MSYLKKTPRKHARFSREQEKELYQVNKFLADFWDDKTTRPILLCFLSSLSCGSLRDLKERLYRSRNVSNEDINCICSPISSDNDNDEKKTLAELIKSDIEVTKKNSRSKKNYKKGKKTNEINNILNEMLNSEMDINLNDEIMELPLINETQNINNQKSLTPNLDMLNLNEIALFNK